MFRFKARIARNSQLLRRFATQKMDILGARYEFMNRSEVPYGLRISFRSGRETMPPAPRFVNTASRLLAVLASRNKVLAGDDKQATNGFPVA